MKKAKKKRARKLRKTQKRVLKALKTLRKIEKKLFAGKKYLELTGKNGEKFKFKLPGPTTKKKPAAKPKKK